MFNSAHSEAHLLNFVMSNTSPLAEALRNRYVLERELGRGGMATVYLARDLKHDRYVALKVLRTDLAAVLGSERFLREIRLSAQLQHPHILGLLDSGEAAGNLFYAMPYIEGESLRERLVREGQLSIEDSISITRAVAGALDYAHQHGVIHRDVKPENILLYQGEPIVADFGVALAAAYAAGERLTETGVSLGTPAYMSPEQASAAPRLDGRSDQYSLACVLYEMLAGEPPYGGPSAQAIIAKRFSEPVPHLSTVRSVPREVESAVTRALSRSPADRFRTVADFAAALERTPSRPLMSRRMAAFIAGTVVFGLVALISWVLRPSARPITVHRQITFTGSARQPAISPDSRWLAYLAGDWPSYMSGDRLLVQDLTSSTEPAAVASSASAIWAPSWTPDGSTLLYEAADSTGIAIYAVSPKGGAARRLSTSGLYGLSPTGDALYSTTQNDSVVVLDLVTGQRRKAFSLSPTASNLYSLAISPNGHWLAFVAIKESTTFLGISRVDGSDVRRLVEGVPRFSTLAWARRSNAIYYLRDLGNGANVAASGDLMKVRIDGRTGAGTGTPTVILGGAFVQSFTITKDGRNLVYTKAPPQQRLWAMTLHGPFSRLRVQARELTTGTSIHGTPDISPDGKTVAFARNDGGTGNIYITPFESYAPQAITNSAADEWSPQWSPDGRRIAFTTRDVQSPGVLVLERTTGQVRRISSNAVAPLGSITWHPGGHHILFPLDLGDHYALVNVTTGQADTLTSPDSIIGFRQTIFSPDGASLAVNALAKGTLIFELWRGEMAKRRWIRVQTPRGLGYYPLLWTKDGWIFLLGDDNALWRVAVNGGPPLRLVALPQACSDWETALSADARRLVCTVFRTEPDIWIAENFDPDAH